MREFDRKDELRGDNSIHEDLLNWSKKRGRVCLDKATILYAINFYVWKLGTRLFYIRNDEFFNTIKNQHSFELNIQKLSKKSFVFLRIIRIEYLIRSLLILNDSINKRKCFSSVTM